MEKKDKLYISIYNDYYYEILTEHQSKIVSMYYNDDLSLNEIAEQLGISPQGVKDTLSRAEKILEATEKKLGLVKKTEMVRSLLKQLEPIVADKEKKDEIKKALELLDK